MTYIVSSGELNSTHSLIPVDTIWYDSYLFARGTTIIHIKSEYWQ